MPHHLSGNCGCGCVKFEIKAFKANVVNCHCNTCRNLNGCSFSTYFVVSEKGFSIIEGEKSLSKFSVSENAVKHFCKNCGTPIYNQNLKYPNLRMVHLGAINLKEEIKPNVNIFCQSKFSWVSFACEIPSFGQEIEPTKIRPTTK